MAALSLVGAPAAVAQSLQPTPSLLLLDEGAEGTGVGKIVPTEDGGALVEGSFVAINGVAQSNIAKVRPDGTLDLGFSLDIDGWINDLVVLSDGDIVITGSFSKINGAPRDGIARLGANGSVDLSWDPQVEFEDQYGNPGLLAADEEGRVYVSSNSVYGDDEVKRISATGTVDPAWHAQTLNGGVAAMVVSGDALYLGGYFDVVNGVERVRLAKLALSDATVDATWDPALSREDGADYFDVTHLLVADGALFVEGDFDQVDGVSRPDVAKVALAGSGVVDPTWAPNSGSVESSANPFSFLGFAREGSIYGFNREASQLVRVPTGGSGLVDPEWVVTIAGGLSPLGYTVYRSPQAVGPLGADILVGGSFAAINGESRYSLGVVEADTAALNDARLDVQGPGSVNVIRRDEDGSIYVGGLFHHASPPRQNLLKLSPDGSVDEGWMADANLPVLSIEFAPDGNLIAGGWFTQIGGFSRSRLAKVSALSGDVDPAWISNAGSGYRADHSVDDLGNVYSGEHKFASNGQLIPDWEAGITNFGNPDNGNVAVVAHDGDVFVAGAKLARLSGSDGSVLWVQEVEGNNFPAALDIVTDDGEWLYVSGRFSSIGGVEVAHVARVSKATGLPDATWTPVESYYRYTNAYLELADGLLFASLTDSATPLIRVDVAEGVISTESLPTTDGYVWNMEVANGRLYLGGRFSRVNGELRTSLAALSLDDAMFSDSFETVPARAVAERVLP